MAWADAIASVEALEDVRFDPALVARMEAAHAPRPLTAALPSFVAYGGETGCACRAGAFPVFSVTGPACALGCAHCRAEILRPMIPATTPEALEAKVRALADAGPLAGFLLSGGSNRRNEIDYRRFWPAVARLKRDLPGLQVAVHSALLDAPRARAMADAGVDLAMMDVIGCDDTIREIYRLDRPVADFEATLDALCDAGLRVAPHIVIGLHRGEIRGEGRALEICLARPLAALVLVLVMREHAAPGTFAVPPAEGAAALFLAARRGRVPVTLGCARPAGLHRRAVDAWAVMAGLDAVAHPAPGALELARAIGRPVAADPACCALGALRRRAA